MRHRTGRQLVKYSSGKLEKSEERLVPAKCQKRPDLRSLRSFFLEQINWGLRKWTEYQNLFPKNFHIAKSISKQNGIFFVKEDSLYNFTALFLHPFFTWDCSFALVEYGNPQAGHRYVSLSSLLTCTVFKCLDKLDDVSFFPQTGQRTPCLSLCLLMCSRRSEGKFIVNCRKKSEITYNHK